MDIVHWTILHEQIMSDKNLNILLTSIPVNLTLGDGENPFGLFPDVPNILWQPFRSGWG